MTDATKAPRLSLIVAMARNGVIGRDNDLPWRIPEDLRYFKQVTLGKPIVMGRRTFESIGRPLPGRKNIVVTRQAAYRAEGVETATDLDAAVALAQAAARRDGADEIMIIGGGALYAEAMPRIERIYMTEIDADIAGDTFFPPLEPGHWVERQRQAQQPTAEGVSYSFVLLERAPG